MKTSKGNVRCRFGRLLTGILSAAMLFSAAAFQIPVSADDEVGGYEVLCDFVKEYVPDASNANITKDGDTIKVNANGAAQKLRVDLSDEVSEKTAGKTVRLHYDFKWEGTSSRICFRNLVGATTSESDALRLGLSTFKKTTTVSETERYQTGYIAYGSGKNCDYSYSDTRRVNEPEEFLKDIWYSVDAIYELGNNKVSYFIDGNKVGETQLDNLNKIKIMWTTVHEWLDGEYYGKPTYCFKNMKLDTGVAAEIVDTDDNGATIELTQPIELSKEDLTVKNLESGNSLDVTVDKINDMKYKLNYDTGVNIGGDYMLTFSDAFAAINGISDNVKKIVYSQKPYVADEVLYDFAKDYTPDNPNITKADDTITVKSKGGSTYVDAVFSEEVAEKTAGKIVKLHYDFMSALDKPVFRHIVFAETSDTNFLRVGLMTFKKRDNETDPYEAYIAYGTGKNCDYSYTESNRVSNPSEFTKDQWYSVDTIYEPGNNKVSYYIDGEKVGETGLDNLNRIQKVRLVINEWYDSVYYGQANYYFKNAKITCSGTETSGIKSVQYSTDGVNYSPATDKVDCETKYVKIDFTRAMDESTLSNINLSDGSSTVAAIGTPSNAGKTYTLELTDKLATRKDYTLNIPTTVKTAGGNSLARAYAGKITTTAGVFRVDLLDIQKSGISVTEGDVAANDTINAIVKITNTEGRTGEAYLCICVYNDKVLKQLKFERIDLAKESEKSVPITVQSIDKIKIKAFLWNNFEAMKPLIPNKTVGE